MRLACTALAGTLLLSGVASAQSGVIVDPENLGAGVIVDPENPGAGVIVDPENPGAGVIVDPENPGAGVIVDPENPGAGAIVDPQNPGPTVAPGRTPAPTSGAPRAVFRGTVTSLAAVDTAHDAPDEDTLLTMQRLAARVRYRISDRWSATVEGRLSWWLTAHGDEGDGVFAIDTAERQGRLEADLRELVVAGRLGRLLLRVGQTTAVWGSTDISGIGDVIHPTDARLGPLAGADDARIPVPLVDATLVWDRAALQALVVPFFVAGRTTVYGGDWALLRPGSEVASGLPLGLVTRAIDPSLEDLVQPLLMATERPEEHLGNASLGARATFSPRGWDLSLGWFWGWDRTPSLELSEPLRALGDAIAGNPPDDPFAFSADLLSAFGEVQAALGGGTPLLAARYDRLHSIVLDGVTYAGPIGLRLDVVASPERTWVLAEQRTVRRPTLSAAFGIGYEDDAGDLIVSTEVLYQRVFTRDGDGRYVYGLDELVATLAGIEWSLATIDALAGRDLARLRFTLAGAALPAEGDVLVAPAIGYTFGERYEVEAGASFTVVGDHELPTVGDFVAPNDAVFARFEASF